MKFLVILFAAHFIVQGLAETSIQSIESAPELNARIIGGCPAPPDLFPYLAHLIMVSEKGQLYTCGGSLITQSWVLTAAHCLVSKTFIIVRLGTVNITTPGLILETTDFIVYPKYNSKTNANDVGLVNLKRVVHTSDSIRPIRLARLSQVRETFANRVVTAGGWGVMVENGSNSEVLRYVNLKIITNRECRKYYGRKITKSQICTAALCADNQAICDGNSGGPLIIREDDGEITQIGVVSFSSIVGCSSNHPSGFTRTASFLKWIESQTDLVVRP